MTTMSEVHEPEIRQRPEPKAVSHESPATSFVEPPLFANVLLEVDSTEKLRRKCSAVSSFLLESLVLGVVLILPLMFTEALPNQQLLTFLVAPPPPPPPPPPAAAAVQIVRRVQSDLMNGGLRTPTRIPQKVEMIRETEAPPPLMTGEGVVGGVPGGIPGGQIGGVFGGIISSSSHLPAVPTLAPVVPKRLRISQGISSGMLIHRVEPTYPSMARQARIQGLVVLSAVISKEGDIENLQALSGHPMLIPAALAAVQQWRFRPYLLNGEPVEVETRIEVTFQFAN
jgi:protein TonB